MPQSSMLRSMRYTVSWATPTALTMLGTDSEVDKRIRIRCTTSSGKRRGIYEDNWLIFYFARVDGCGSALLDYFDTHNIWIPLQPPLHFRRFLFVCLTELCLLPDVHYLSIAKTTQEICIYNFFAH